MGLKIINNHSKRKIILALSFIFIFILIGCEPSSKSKMEYYDQTISIDLSKENINSITLNSVEKDVVRVNGKPASIEAIEKPKSKYYIYGKDGSEDSADFKIADGKVVSIQASNKKYKTVKGLTVGSTKAEIIEAYGKNYYQRTDTGANILGYIDKGHKINLEFSLDHNKVMGLILTYMNDPAGANQ